MDDYKEIFLAEANEYMQVLNDCLMRLEDDPQDAESLQEIFRAVHSLKGMSGTMGFDLLKNVSHDLENFMEEFKGQEHLLNAEIVDFLFESVDVFQGLLIDPENPGEEEREVAKNYLEKIANYHSHVQEGDDEGGAEAAEAGGDDEKEEAVGAAAGAGSGDDTGEEDVTGDEEQACEAALPFLVIELGEIEKEIMHFAKQRGDQAHVVRVDLLEGAMMKSVRAYMVLRALEQFGEIVTTEPSQHDLDEEKFEQSFKVLLISPSLEAEKLKEEVLNIAEVQEVTVTSWEDEQEQMQVQAQAQGEGEGETQDGAQGPDEGQGEQGQARSQDQGEGADQAGKKPGAAGESAAQEGQEQPVAEDKDKKQDDKQDKSPAKSKDQKAAKGEAGAEDCKEKPKSKAPAAPAKVSEKMVRVETAKLDDLINLIGEMVIMRNSVMEKGTGMAEELDQSLDQMDRVITELQNVSMQLRMVPIKQVFERFPRMMRDICRDRGKEVKLDISGEETELDRSIINQLSDPLVHILRNAVDHGIETPEERESLGKNRTGHIHIKAFHESNHVVLTIEDNGRGMDPEKIKKSALEKNVVDEEEISRMSDEEAINLVFRSGFSTAAQITDVSGRGVGMDAVKNSVESMRGSIEIQSEVGKGSLFILRFPLTLAIIKALLVKAGGYIFAIPIESIRENVILQPEQIKTIQREWVVNMRGEVFSLYDLGSLLNFSPINYQEKHEFPVVIIEMGQKKAGFMVDELLGQQEVVIKSLGTFLKEIKGITGATVLGDGRVTLIIDVLGLLEDRRVEVG